MTSTAIAESLALTMLFNHSARPLSDSMTSLYATSGKLDAIELSHVFFLVEWNEWRRGACVSTNKAIQGLPHQINRKAQSKCMQWHTVLPRGGKGLWSWGRTSVCSAKWMGSDSCGFRDPLYIVNKQLIRFNIALETLGDAAYQLVVSIAVLRAYRWYPGQWKRGRLILVWYRVGSAGQRVGRKKRETRTKLAVKPSCSKQIDSAWRLFCCCSMLHLEHIPVRKGERTRYAREKNNWTCYLESVDEALLCDRVVALGAMTMVTKPERMAKQKGLSCVIKRERW